MADWKESAKKSIERRTAPNSETVQNNNTFTNTPARNTENSNDWREQAKKSLVSRGYVAGNKNPDVYVNKNTEEKENKNPVFKRYNIDPDNFTLDDLDKWAKSHNFEVRQNGEGFYYAPKYDGGFLGFGGKKKTTDEEDEDLKTLKLVAENNERKKTSGTDMGKIGAAIVGVGDGISFGAMTGAIKLGDKVTKKQYEKLGLDENTYAPMTDTYKKTVESHPIANTLGNIAGSIPSFAVADKAVTAGLSNIPKYAILADKAAKGVATAQKTKNLIDAVATVGATTALTSSVAQDWKKDDWYKSIGNVVLDTATSSLGAYLGGKLGSVIGQNVAMSLKNTKLSTAAIKGMASASGALSFAGTTTGIQEMKNAVKCAVSGTEYRPDIKSIATNMVVLTLYSAIKTYVKESIGTANAPKYEELFEYFTEEDMKSPEALKKKMRQYTKMYHPDLFKNKGDEAFSEANRHFSKITSEYDRAKQKCAVNIVTNMENAQNNTQSTSKNAETVNNAVELLNEIYSQDSAYTVSKSASNTTGTPTIQTGGTAAVSSPKTKSAELSDISNSDTVPRFTPKGASSSIERLENILIAQGADDTARQEIVDAALKIDNDLDGKKDIRSVFNNVAKITSGAVAEIKNKAGVSNSYWKLFIENLKAIQSGNVTENEKLISEYANAFVKALKNTNPDKYNSAVVAADGTDLTYEIPRTITQNIIPTKVKNAGEYRLIASYIKNIIGDADIQISNERTEIYGEDKSKGDVGSIKTKPPKNITLTRIGDFYEIYGNEAVDVANRLNLTLTPKTVDGKKTQMVGFPVSSLEAYKVKLGENYIVNFAASNENTPDKTKPKIIRAKKGDWSSHDVYWYAPNSKTVVAYSTKAASDLIEAMALDNPTMTVSEMLNAINYDEEAKKVLQAYITSGFGNDIASNHFTRENVKKVNGSDEQIQDNATADEPELTDKCELISTKHTATGNDIWVVTLKERLTAEDYKELKEKVKAVGGYYSRFAKTPDGKAVPGFVFKNKPGIKEFTVFNDFFASETEAGKPEIQTKEAPPEKGESNGKLKEPEIAAENGDKKDIKENALKDKQNGVIIKNESTNKIADYVTEKLKNGEKIISPELSKISAEVFGGTMADNAYSVKDMYDAMELGVNKYILSLKDVSPEKMLNIMELLPAQTKRTEDMIKFQQFSTPPSIAFLANYAANVNANDIMLEPSAGIGGIAVFAKKDGAMVYANELDNRRLEILKNMPFDGFFNENAEQLDNILGGKIEPTVIVMNPPFSSSSERNIQNTKIGAKHIEQALKILAPDGRLVAIVGHGMNDGAPAFRGWWKDIKSKYNVKANIGINGKNYSKYGTNFDIQMLVIDKNGPTVHTETGYVDTLQELQEKLEGIRNERPIIDYSSNEQRTFAAVRSEAAQTGKAGNVGNGTVSHAGSVADKGKSADMRNIKERPERENIQQTDGNSGKLATDEPKTSNAAAVGQSADGRGKPRRNSELQDSRRTDISDSGQHNIQSISDRGDGISGDGRNNVGVQRPKRKELTDSIFEQYQPQPLQVKNAQPHPAKVSESAAMSAIEPPAIVYKPNIAQSIIDRGIVSDVQLEAISYAGQSHSQTLPDKSTRGFFLGDGTGIGKGRTIAGIILDNYNQGRKKSLWVTLNASLVNDAKRDAEALFGNSDLVTQFVGGKKAESVLNTDEAIMVVSYSALSKGFDSDNSNFKKIINWLGEDFDGVIVFDEAHKMGNATAVKGTRGIKKASQTGLAGIALQKALPKAKIVYSSATGATEVENLRYAERLGLWGEGTAFATGDDFVSNIKAGGLAAMELIARDMKAMGVYLSRNISYEDVRYDKITHKLTNQQRKIYDELARSWQIVLNNINKALDVTNQNKDGTARGRALGAFWSSQQRFFNQILTSMQVPSVIEDIEKQLADGKSCVIQLVSTNEAAQNEEFARLKAEDLELDEFDLTPKQMLMSYIENSFPTQQYEEYRDDDGNKRSKPVYDSKGNPVLNRDAVRQRDELLSKLGSIKVPSSPIDMIINHFGTDLVAENTGRARRVIQKDGKFTEEKIGSKKDADVDAFQNGKKRIIIFSKAGGTGKSYHADKAAKNQQQRVHYLLEAGWQADNAVQGFGRSHRSNQASAPIFKLVTTDLKGQMRFISTIAKRLDQLGAMTKGQRQAGGQGMFSASDNLENSFAADVLAVFYKDLALNRVDGIDNGLEIIEKLGLKEKILDDYNRIIVTAPELREVNKFLNRILSLESSEQNTVFDGYSERLQDATEKAMLAGTLDKGLENYKADKITLNEVKDIREDKKSGAKTKYYHLTAEHKITPVKFEDIPTKNKAFAGFYQNKMTGAVRAVMKTSSTTDKYGNVTDNFKLVGQVKNDYIPQQRLYGNWSEIDVSEAEKLWNDEISKLPEYRKENLHLISGVVLPVWDKLPTENVHIYRVLTSDGEMLIGRVVSEDKIDETLRRLGSSREKEKIGTKDLINGVKNGDTAYLDNGWKITQRKVSGENRIEIVGPSYEYYDMLAKKGVFTERIQYNTRYFIPANTNTEKVLDEILKISPLMRVENAKYSLSNDDFETQNDTEKPFTVDEKTVSNLSKQIDKWFAGDIDKNEYFDIGNTPIVLQKLGANKLPVVMSQNVMVKINGAKHSISLDEIKSIPQAIANPIMVFKSATVDNAFVMLTTLNDNFGNDVIAAIHLNKKHNRINVNNIASVYGKDNISNFVQTQFNLGNVKYLDKIKSQEWSTSRGLRLPKLVQSNPDNNIILYKDDIVNMYYTQNNEKYSAESEGTSNDRGDLLSGNGGRGSDESARKQTQRISKFKQEIKGKTKKERSDFAKELLAKGQTEEVTDGNHRYNLVKPEAYNDDMLSIVEQGKRQGAEVEFFIGNGIRRFDGQREFLIDAIKTSDTKILLRYDGSVTPQSLLKHESIHININRSDGKIQNAKDMILGNITDAEKKKILSEGRYKNYMDLYNDENAVWEEFIADVFAGMNDYTPDYIDIVADYWNGSETVDSYSPSQYNEIADAGGRNAEAVENLGISDDYISLKGGDLNGSENTERVGKRGTHKNDNSIWERSDDSKEIYRSMGTSEKRLQRGESSGYRYIDWGRRFRTFDVYEPTEKEYAYGTLRKVSRINTADVDQNGRKLSKEQKAYFKNTVAKNTKGELIPLYHATDNNFDVFSMGDFAYHVGDVSQAIDLQKKYIKEVYINLTNPVFIEYDAGAWCGNDIARALEEQGIISDNEYKSLSELDGFYDNDSNSAANSAIKELLKNRGYDGIVYRNDYETKGLSFMLFDSSQIKYTSNRFPTLSDDIRYSLTGIDNDIEELTPERKKEIFEQFEKDRAEVPKLTKRQLWGERAAWVAHNMTRVFPNIPERGKRGEFFAEFRKNMIQWKNLPTTASFMVQDKLNKMTDGLTPKEFKTFSELVYFLDLQEEAQIQRDKGYTDILLPNGITPNEVDGIVKELNTEANETVRQALIKRQNTWNTLKTRYIELNRYIGFDTDGKFKRKNYYHHQVIEYMNKGGNETSGGEIGIKAGRGWLKERQGSTKAINTDFLAVEYKAMLQMQYDVYIAETLGKIKAQYDIKPQLENEAFKNNKKALNDIIRSEATNKNGDVVLDNKGKPDSETYRQQMWYNSRIMFGFSGLFNLAERNELSAYNGEYTSVVEALKKHNLDVPGLYKYVGIIAGTDLPDNASDAQEQAVLNARTILKYTSQKREWVKGVLGDKYQTWETIAKAMSDTHVIHQPRRGNYFYTKTVIDEDAFNQAYNEMVLSLTSGEVDLGNIDLNKLFTQYAETIRLTGAAYEQWVLPKEIVDTMNEIANPKQASEGAKAARAIVSSWKGWATSVNPLRTVKFGLRNLAGDLDAVIAGNPKITLFAKKAVQDIWQAMRHKNYSPDFMEWVERGGYTSMIFANEMDTEMQDKLFSNLKEKQGTDIFKIPLKLFEGYLDGVENAHNFREAILRYSAYLYFKDEIKRNNGNVKDYVASNRYIVRGLNTIEDKAYQLSKDLLGAYDEVGKMGQTLRRYWVPFYSFTETNLKRYYRMFENILASDDKISKKAGKLLLKALMVNMLGLLISAWNRFVTKDADDKLPPQTRNIPHITFGEIGGKVYAFRQLGSFTELLEWFGLDDYKLSKEDITAPLDKAWGMVTPFLKLPVELVSGLNFYPSLSQPRAIRDKWQHFFNSFGVDSIYNEVTGKPTRGVSEIVKGSFLYSYDYKESAYYEILDIKREYQKKTDNTIYGADEKSNALYYMKTAIRYKDRKAALKYLDKYFENGGTAKGIKQSFATLNPMYGFTSKNTIEKGKEFVASLTEEQKEKLKIAQEYYENDLMLPEVVLNRLGKKDITDEEAKNLLKNYISAKCN